MNHVDVYPVGLFRDWKNHRLREGVKYLARQIRRKEFRAIKCYFNGYLAEHESKGTRCGHGWTKRRAMKDLIGHLLSEI